MRKPKDFDAELQAMSDRAKTLKAARLSQLGELVVATGAAALGTEVLTGALLVAVGNEDAARREAWRKRGAAFFQQTKRRKATQQTSAATSGSADRQPGSAASNTSAAQPADAGQSPQ